MKPFLEINSRGHLVERVTYKGVVYSRWPDSKQRSERDYYKRGKVFLHRLIYEEHFGDILSGYHIHHKDGNPQNNDYGNLEMLSAKDHANKTIDNRNGEKKACEFCGEEFTDWSPTRTKRFCSPKHASAQKRKDGRLHIPAKCLICGSDFQTPSWKPAKTCSPACRNKRISEVHTVLAAENPKQPITANCNWCGKEFAALTKKGKWCNMTCRSKFVSMQRRIMTVNRQFAKLLDKAKQFQVS